MEEDYTNEEYDEMDFYEPDDMMEDDTITSISNNVIGANYLTTSQKLWKLSKNFENYAANCWKDGEPIFEQQNIIPMHWVSHPSQNYNFMKVLGQGRYGQVYKAVNKQTGEIVACKVVKRKDEYLRELNHLVAIENAYGILPLKGVSFADKQMIMEFQLGECSLRDHLSQLKPTDPLVYSNTVIGWFEEILKSIVDIHKHRILHRDIKPDNIVMVKENDQFVPKIIDFGLSKRIVGDCAMSDSIWYDVYTCYYRPPELWQKDPRTHEYRKYSIKAESWALGCLLIEMITQKVVFRGEKTKKSKLIPDTQDLIANYIKKKLGHNPFESAMHASPRKDVHPFVEDWNFEKAIEQHFFNILKRGNSNSKIRLVKNQEKMLGKGTVVKSFIVNDLSKELFERNFIVFRMLIYGLLNPLPEKRWFPLDCLRILQYLRLSNIQLREKYQNKNVPSPIHFVHNANNNNNIKLSTSMEFSNTSPHVQTSLRDFLTGTQSPNERNLIKMIDTRLNLPSILEMKSIELMKNNKVNLLHYKLFYDYPFHRTEPHNEEIIKDKTLVINILEKIFNLAKQTKPEPKPFFQAIYLWIVFLFNDHTKWRQNFLQYHQNVRKNFAQQQDNQYENMMVRIVIEIFFGCLDLIDDYCFSENAFIHHMIDKKSIFKPYFDIKRLSFTKDYIICHQQGRVWIHNPGELRYMFFDHVQSTLVWDSHVDNQICDVILHSLKDKFVLPHPDNVIESVKF